MLQDTKNIVVMDAFLTYKTIQIIENLSYKTSSHILYNSYTQHDDHIVNIHEFNRTDLETTDLYNNIKTKLEQNK